MRVYTHLYAGYDLGSDARHRLAILYRLRTFAQRRLAIGRLLGALSFTLIPGISSGLASRSGSTEQVEDLTLRDLLDLPVFTPSRQSDSVHNTPAMISVITAEEIADMGADNLYDVLNTVPGIEVVQAAGGTFLVIFRGVLPADDNNKCLLMLNGHPLREFQNGSAFLEAIPIAAVAQLEIVRGPGSVQYGTNAFAGVINVITKDGKDPNANRISIQYGTYKTANVDASAGVAEGDFSAFIAAQHHASDGYPIAKQDNSGQINRFRNRNDFDNAYIRLDWKNFEINGQYFSNTQTLLGQRSVASDSHGINWRESATADLRYQRSFFDRVSVFALLYVDHWWKRTDISQFSWPPGQGPAPITEGYPYSGSQWGSEGRVSWQALPWLRVSSGVRYDLNISDKPSAPAPELPFDRNTDIGVFAEVFLNPSDRLGVTAGVRYDNNSDSGGFVVPRVGAVYGLSQDFSLKLLFGRAYRRPSVEERDHAHEGADVPEFQSRPPYAQLGPTYELKAEKIGTVELGFDWKLRKHALRVNAFYLQTSDVISLSRRGFFQDPLSPVPVEGVRFGNTLGYSVVGGEAELRGYPTDSLF